MTARKYRYSKKYPDPNKVNYAEIYRRTAPYHAYSFDLPRGYITKANSEKARKSPSLRSYIKYDNPSVPEILAATKRIAMDYYINDKLSETPQRKSAIRMSYYGNESRTKLGLRDHIENDTFQFVELPNANRRKKLTRYTTTKKGVFIQTDENEKASIKGKGKTLHFEFEPINYEPEYIGKGKKRRKLPPIKTQLFPIPRGVNIADYIEGIQATLEKAGNAVKNFQLYIMGFASKASYEAIHLMDYAVDYLSGTDDELEQEVAPISGVLFRWY